RSRACRPDAGWCSRDRFRPSTDWPSAESRARARSSLRPRSAPAPDSPTAVPSSSEKLYSSSRAAQVSLGGGDALLDELRQRLDERGLGVERRRALEVEAERLGLAAEQEIDLVERLDVIG